MDITNLTDHPVRFRRVHRFGDEQPTIVTLAPGETLPTSQVHDFTEIVEAELEVLTEQSEVVEVDEIDMARDAAPPPPTPEELEPKPHRRAKRK